MNTLPSPQGIAAAYQGNPQPLQQKVQKQGAGPQGLPNDLVDALALQMVLQQQTAAKNQLAMQQGGQKPDIVSQLRDQAVGNARSDIQQKLGAQSQQAQQQQGLQALAQQGGAPQSGGVDQLPSGVGQHLAGGGIVAFNGEDEDQVVDGDTSQLSKDWQAFTKPYDTAKGARAAEEKRINAIAQAARDQRALEEAQQKAADTAAGPLGYAFSPASQYKDAQYVLQNLKGSRNYDNETKRGIAALADAASTAPAVDDRTRRTPSLYRSDVASPNAEAQRTRQVGDAGIALGTQVDDNIWTPGQLAALRNAADAGSAEAQRALSLYMAKHPEAAGGPMAVSGQVAPSAGSSHLSPADSKFTQDYQKILLQQLGADPLASQNRAADYERTTVGAQPILDEQKQRALALQQLQEQQKGLRNPTYEFLRGIAESRPGWGGMGMQMLGGANRYSDAKTKWGAEDVTNQEGIDKLLNAVGTTQIAANTGVAKAGQQGYSDATRLLGTALTAGANESGRIESAAQRAEAARYTADERLQAMRERMANAASQSQAAKAAEIRAQATETVAVMRDLTTELDKIDPGMAMADKNLAARRTALQNEINMWRSHLAKLHGVSVDSGAGAAGGAKPSMKYNPQTGKLEAI